MRKFLLRTSAFLAATLCVIVSLLIGVVFLNHRAIASCRVAPDVKAVILGDSHPAWSIDDSFIPGVRNISLNAEGYKYTYAKLRHLLDTSPNVQRIYLGFSYHNLSSYFDEYVTGPTFRFFAARYLPVLEARDIVELVVNSPATAPDLLRGLLREGLSLGIRTECRLYGRFSEEPMRGKFDKATMERRIAEQYFDTSGNLRDVSEQNLHYLIQIIELARKRNVELIMISTPLHPEYERRVPQRFRDLYQQVIATHQLKRFEFRGLVLADDDFLPDGDHTNYQGAMRATRYFAAYHHTETDDGRERGPQ